MLGVSAGLSRVPGFIVSSSDQRLFLDYTVAQDLDSYYRLLTLTGVC